MIRHLVSRGILDYEARGVWDHKTGGKIHLPDLQDLKFDTPTEFGGLGRYACADQLFLSSLAACLIATFLYFRRKLRFTPIRVEANVKAKIALVGGCGYQFSGVKTVLLVLSKKDDLAVARRCADLAVAYCHLTQTVGEVVPTSVKSVVRGPDSRWAGRGRQVMQHPHRGISRHRK